MKLSVAITTYNRYEMTIQSFEKVLNDDRIEEIVIVDDASTDDSFLRLSNHFKGIDKVRLIQQVRNRGMGYNKFSAVSYCKNQFVALWDSDNVFDKSYLDALEQVSLFGELDDDTIYCPDYAMPSFDYREFAGMSYTKDNIKDFLDKPMFRCLLNTANYVVPKDRYIKTYEENPAIKAADTIWMNFLWLKAGYSLFVVPGMKYGHLQHEGSHFLEHVEENLAKAKEIENLIRAL